MAPDRITEAAGQVQTAAHDLVGEVKAERRTRRRNERRVVAALIAVAVALVAIVVLVVFFRLDAVRDRERRDEQRQRDEAELIDRQCQAWQNRIEDHAVLVDYLAEFAGERGADFVEGLRAAYADSDAEYAAQRGLTEERCA